MPLRGTSREAAMRKNKYIFVFLMLLAITLAGGIFTGAYIRLDGERQEQKGIHVVTSFYPVYIAALNVAKGSPGVVLENLSEPQSGCMHDYQLTPQDMIRLSKADLFLVNGGGIESFLADVGRSYPQLSIVKATEGLDLSDDGNAHVWMDTRYYAGMVRSIAEALKEADPANAQLYQTNAEDYCEEIGKLTDEMEELREAAEGKPVVIFHEAYEYVAGELGMDTVYCLDLDEERQISAHEVAEVMGEISRSQVSVVFAEELYGKDMGDTVEAETQAKVCYLDALVRGDYRADSYLSAVRENIKVLRQSLCHTDR